ncbi:MAG: hypothetical protein NUV77_17345, partial [Thermoguttaceae bacterium]|nr:hypothetical protein [Thermoguttaceae bacterium]
MRGFGMLLAWILAAALGADNPCTNGSFEALAPNGFPADWGPVGKTIEVSTEAHSGKRALRFVRQAGTDPRIETGLNRLRLLDRLQGGMEFWYKAVSAKDAKLRIYAIPINADGVEKTDSSRVAFTVPAGHVGDGQWHRGRIKYDFTKDPKVKSLHFAVRIEGEAGELLVDDFAYLDRVGPVLRFGTVRLDEDPKQPGRRARVYVPLFNDGDAPARDVRAVLSAPAGLAPQPAELRLGDLAPGKRVLVAWTLEGSREGPATLSAGATTGDEKASTTLPLAPQLVVRSFGPLTPVAAVGRPVTMECVLANPGSVAVRQPAVVFRLGNESVTVPAESIAPKTSVTLRAALVPKAQGEVQFGASFRATGPVEIPAPLQGTMLVGAAGELPPPSGGLRAAATPECAILENERLRLAFRRNGFGFGPAEIAVKNPAGWETVAWTGSLGRVRDRAAKDAAQWMSAFAEKPPVAISQPGKPARLEFEAALRGYVLRVAWELAAGARQVACRAELTAVSPHEVVDFEGPVGWVLR